MVNFYCFICCPQFESVKVKYLYLNKGSCFPANTCLDCYNCVSFNEVNCQDFSKTCSSNEVFCAVSHLDFLYFCSWRLKHFFVIIFYFLQKSYSSYNKMTVKGCASACTPYTTAITGVGSVTGPVDIFCCQGNNCNAADTISAQAYLIFNLLLAIFASVIDFIGKYF